MALPSSNSFCCEREVQADAAESGDLDTETAADAEDSLKKAAGASKSAGTLAAALAAAYAKIQGWW